MGARMKQTTVFQIATGLLLIGLSGVVNATIIASSNFDTGNDGWTWLAADPGISWQSSGGNPDGYMRFNNNIPYGSGATASIYAPLAFLGDWAVQGVTKFSYEAEIFSTGSFIRSSPYRAYISGSGGIYRWDGPAPNPTADWLLLDASLVESGWTLISGPGNWNDTISNVTELRISMAYYTNTSSFEITGIDNVTLHAASVPEPTTIALMGLGLAGIGWKRRKAA